MQTLSEQSTTTVLYYSKSNKQKHTQLSTMLSFVSKCYTVITLIMSICVEPVSFWNTGLVICVQAVLEHWVSVVFNHCLEHWVTFLCVFKHYLEHWMLLVLTIVRV